MWLRLTERARARADQEQFQKQLGLSWRRLRMIKIIMIWCISGHCALRGVHQLGVESVISLSWTQ
eukprot:6153368-Amphidinium_carterae.1